MSTQTKIRQISLSADALHIKSQSIEVATEAFMEHIQEAALKLAHEGVSVGNARIVEVKAEEDVFHFKFDDPDNFIDHIALHLNAINPKAKIEVHHTSARS
ncbi:hypothetical protein [uncultured Kordia sp.]|uniref:hypothetical protein n=1 Tax=uncultured Kordia sp. TaxID=507699 RepID=UPI002625F0C4|nr:hypothetical protein [uncultured Kordia sp.]